MSRPKGSKNAKTEQWEQFADWFLLGGMKRLKTEMQLLEGKDFIYTVRDLMEYFKPKLARTQNDVTITGLNDILDAISNKNKQ